MQAAGFRYMEDTGCWRLYREIGDCDEEISFNVIVPSDGRRDGLRIEVLDEDFCQPYDYQRILRNNKDNEYARNIACRVEEEMRKLAEAGIITGHNRGDYI